MQKDSQSEMPWYSTLLLGVAVLRLLLQAYQPMASMNYKIKQSKDQHMELRRGSYLVVI